MSGFSGELHLGTADDTCLWALQDVSDFGGELYLDDADNACLWLFSW